MSLLLLCKHASRMTEAVQALPALRTIICGVEQGKAYHEYLFSTAYAPVLTTW